MTLNLIMPPNIGSTVIIVVPLHTIEAQLVLECGRLGIPAVAGSQVNLKFFSEMAKILSPTAVDFAKRF